MLSIGLRQDRCLSRSYEKQRQAVDDNAQKVKGISTSISRPAT